MTELKNSGFAPCEKLFLFLDTENLKDLGKKFNEVDEDKKGCISTRNFIAIFKQVFGEKVSDDEIEDFSCKLDPYSFGVVAWAEVITYCLMYNKYENQGVEDAYRPFLEPPQVHMCLEHNDTTVSLEIYKNPDDSIDYLNGNLISASRNGIIIFWNPDMEVVSRNPIEPNQKKSKGQVTLGITSMICLPDVSMIAVATTSWDLRFYDSTPSAFQRYFSIVEFPKSLKALDYSFRLQADSLLVCGDDEGSVHIMWLDPSFFLKLRLSMVLRKTLSEILFGHVCRKLIRGVNIMSFNKLHSDSVVKVKYFPDVHTFVSCSACTKEAMFMYDFDHKTRQFFKSMKGILCFDYCKLHDWLISGGMDNHIKIWNRLACSRPSQTFYGHISPVSHLLVDSYRQLLISLSTIKIVKVWYLDTGNCLQTISCKDIGLGLHDVSAILYNPLKRILCLHTHQFALYTALDDFHPQYLKTHDKPVRTALYNSRFNCVISGSDSSDVAVWDLTTGKKIIQFKEAHQKLKGKEACDKRVPISSMHFDDSKRRLVTAACDGTIKIWNFNTGICLSMFETEQKEVINAIAHYGNLFYVAGNDRKVSIVYDDGETTFDRNWEVFHKDDIMSMDIYRNSVLATASSDGEIIIWIKEIGVPRHRMIDDGSRFNEYRKLYSDAYLAESGEDKTNTTSLVDKYVSPVETKQSISRMLFLQSRPNEKEVATLLTCSRNGMIRLWSIRPGSSLLGRFCATGDTMAAILSIASDARNKYLLTGDSSGYIQLWELTGYCNPFETVDPERMEDYLKRFPYLRLQKLLVEKGMIAETPLLPPCDIDLVETRVPLLLNRFRAHLESISSIGFIDRRELILTSSWDGNVRLWDLSGSFVGNFGSKDLWNINALKPLPPSQQRNMPTDIRRSASPTTLKVINNGYCPRWEHGFKLMRRCRRKGTLHLASRAEKQEKLEKEPILGKYFVMDEPPIILPKIEPLYDINFKVSAFAALKATHLDERKPVQVTKLIASSLVRQKYITRQKKNKSEKGDSEIENE